MRIGIITAMAQECLPIYKKLGNIVATDKISGVEIRQIETNNHTIYLATGGIGEIKAAITTQLLIDLFDIEVVLNFGFVGALNSNLEVGEMVIAEKVCHYQFDLSAIDGTEVGQYEIGEDKYFYLDQSIIEAVMRIIKKPIKLVSVASGDKFIASNVDKQNLKSNFGADICEMELAGIAITASRNNLPVFSLKIVSDKTDENAVISFTDVLNNGLTKYEDVIPQILEVLKGEKFVLPPKVKQKSSIKIIKQ